MRQKDFARTSLNTTIIIIAALALSGCLEQEENETSGFVPANDPPPNAAPTIAGRPASTVRIGEMYSFVPNASDGDGDALTFSIDNKPRWANFSTSSGELAGQPTLGDVGTHSNITISVSDGTDTASLAAFSISVMQDSASNSPPSISGSPATTVVAGSAYSFVPVATDPENDSLTFSISGQPGWASFSSATGELSGMPQAGNVGSYANIVISVSDGEFSDSLSAFTIDVIAPAPSNTPPTISGTPATRVDAGSMYSFTPVADDADGDRLTFDITNRPSWASFSTATGTLQGMPDNGDAGVYRNIAISVSDGSATANLSSFSIEVVAVATNTAPTIRGNPPSQVDAGSPYSFTPTADDADGDTLTFDITNRPAWANFNSSTGQLSGTPDDGDVGDYNNITITVSDGEDSASLGPFSIEVVAVATNTAPTITGNPPSQVESGSPYSFAPTADDADGDRLTFDITNRPAWANFNSSTGLLSGTPDDMDVGDYNNITITVSDGEDSASLGPFSITVSPVMLGSVTLSWTAPVENEDGTALTDLAGYKIYWGTTPGVYTDSVTLNNPGLTSYVVEGLVPGTYEFVATSFNNTGIESTYSNPATIAVQP